MDLRRSARIAKVKTVQRNLENAVVMGAEVNTAGRNDPVESSATGGAVAETSAGSSEPVPVTTTFAHEQQAKSNSKSSKRSCSGSIVSQRRILEARAARVKAELERQRILAEQAVVNAQLEEQLAMLESSSRESSAESRRRTELWVDQACQVLDDDAGIKYVPNECHYEEIRREHNVRDATRLPRDCIKVQSPDCNSDLVKLTNVISDAIKLNANNNNACSHDKLLGRISARDLPSFSGDALDWLRFKNAFETTTKIGQYTEEENLARLQRCLHGEAWEAVAARLITATPASQVMKILEMRFGRSDLILRRLIDDMKSVPKLSGARSELIILATKVDNCVAAIQACGDKGQLYNSDLVSVIVGKLTEPIFYRWADFCKRLENRQPKLLTLAEYLMSEANEISRLGDGAVEPPQKLVSNKKRPLLFIKEDESPDHIEGNESPDQIDNAVNCNLVDREGKVKIKARCVLCNVEDHVVSGCPKFKSMSVSERWECVSERKLCFRCLRSTHRRDRCRSKVKCKLCRGRHNSLLHKDEWKQVASISEGSSNDATVKFETAANVWAQQERKVILKVLPVELEGPCGRVTTYALLDEGSTVTLVEKEIADSVGAVGPESSLNLQGAVGNAGTTKSHIVSLILRSPDGVEHRLDRVRTVDNLTLPVHTISESQLTSLDHLKGLPLHAFSGQPTILIGQDNWHLIVTREIREGEKNDPVASRTSLGWVLHGFVSSVAKTCIPELTLHIRQEDDLHDMVKDYFLFDSLGVRVGNNRRFSKDELRALDILDKKSNKLEERWETGLLWRSDDVVLPDNKRYAEARLKTVEKMMDSDPNYAADYTNQIDNMLNKHYAERIVENPSGRVWFLPHFGVKNPNKPKKLRVVFDAKAETKGVSLNSELLPGPDLLNSLLGVLFGFRERAVAVCADLREMFLQVKIIAEDQTAQCFLWRGMDREKPPCIYKMTSMTFGATSSPCTATYILRRNADQFASTNSRAVEAIKKRHYVDDYLDSVDTVEEMKQLINDVTVIHKAGGFEIRGWCSNKPEVLPIDGDNKECSLLLQEGDMERILGLIWRPNLDTFGFDLSFKKIDGAVIEGLRRPTKREILKVVMSIFDPLGMLCPFLIRGKIMLQEVWRSGLKWDEQVHDEIWTKWFLWLKDLKELKLFSVPRCYGFFDLNEVELHVFVDASEEAYSAVAYFRRELEVMFVAGKSRVAPLKSSTVPRLELQAALMGARLGHTITKEHGFQLSRRVFWTDSLTVWRWVQNNPRQNVAFVSNRLAEIDELTKTEEWKWLPGQLNVADGATRYHSKLKCVSSKWIQGPDFLRCDEIPKFQPDSNKEGVIVPVASNSDFVLNIFEPMEKLIDDRRFSNFRRVVRAMAYVLYFIDKCRRKVRSFTPQFEHRAEVVIFKQIQAESFADNKDRMRAVFQLNPEKDEEGLVRSVSRIDAGHNLPLGLRRPIILDGRHHLVRLLIEYKHKKLGHQNDQTLLNELRQHYFIFRLRYVIRSITSRCVICRIRRGRNVQPMMAGLPTSRLHAYCRPFTYCGVDLFGPLNVSIGRRIEKRWVVLFTCFSVRAVHIELANSLSTDSTILALRRMAARRGLPKQIHSDNGTNFRGADRELQKAIRELLLDDKLKDEITGLGIVWTFNPPEAPHMGGVWERLVRSIKSALNAVLNSRNPKEEVLLTLLIEAENMVNSRPLTHVSLDPNEEEALTPNHFLVGSSNALFRPGQFSDSDLCLRRQWRIAQRLADYFWHRWIREYLPTLQARKKWNVDRGNCIKIGDIVLIVDYKAPRNTWPRGRVLSTIPGRDGRIRVVDVETKGGVLRRPVSKIVILTSVCT